MQLQNNKIIELDNVEVGYNSNMILSGINLQINEGDFMAITGPNGGGKTTLLRVILGLMKPTKGRVKYFNGDKEVKKLNIGYLPQKNAIDHRFPITVKEVVASGLMKNTSVFSNRLSNTENDKVTEILNLVGMTQYGDYPIGNLSGGQLQRVLFGRSIVSSPAVLILDEPLSYVDKTFEIQFYEMIGTLSKKTTVILVSHEMARIMEMANRHIIVDRRIEDCHARRHFIRTACK